MDLYGIPSCDTCRKAKKALEAAGYDVRFRDFRADPLTETERDRFFSVFGEKLLNRASTSWRELDEPERRQPPAELLARYPTLMKRPVIDTGSEVWLGWAKDVQAALIK